jgi:adenosylmethionine---8-amino-7-oxononanoate aminotransferase
MSASLVERDRKSIWHPFTHQKEPADPVAVAKGEGIYLIDEDGKKYIDAISSWWVNLHGHAHPYIAEQLYKQARTLEHIIFAGFTHEPAVQLAERLLNILPPGFSKIFYSDNGSTSTEVALKMSLQFWWNQRIDTRKKILALKNAYHGDTFGSMSMSDRSVFTMAFNDRLFEVDFITTTDLSDPSLRLSNPTDYACFIYEPLVQGAGGMQIYEAASLETMLRFCKQHSIICIADEVMTGFGRTGKLFASLYCDTPPDIICLSKGLTGGALPLGVTACTAQIHEAFVTDDKTKTFFHGHSFTANPLACTAANASLDLLLNEACFQRIERICDLNAQFVSQLESEGNNQIRGIRALGTIVAFELEAGADGYLNAISSSVTARALGEGIYLRPLGNTVYIMPPYCISESELATVHEFLSNLKIN